MFERLINRVIHKLWKPVRWDIRTDDRQVQLAEMRRKVSAVGAYRFARYVPEWEPPRWDGRAGGRAAEAAYNGLRWTADVAGDRLYTMADKFVARVRDARVTAQLAEIEERIEHVATRWMDELCDDLGIAV